MTRKEEQRILNSYVEKNYDVFKDCKADYYWNYHHERLFKCSATVYQTPDFIVLKSYNTIVAFVNRHSGEGFDILRLVYGYTSTSAQHIRKFFNMYARAKINTYYPI